MKQFTVGDLIRMVRGNVPKSHPLYKSTSDRLIYNTLVSLRYKIISDNIYYEKEIRESEYTILPCVEVIEVPKISCKCLSYLSCETISRTKHKIPKPFFKNGKPMIERVESLLGERFSIVSANRRMYPKGNRYSDKSIKAVYENEYLFFEGTDVPKVIQIKLLSQDLDAVDKFPNFCIDGDCKECIDCYGYTKSNNSFGNSDPCLSMYEKIFPISPNQVDTLIGLARERLFSIEFNDNNNDKRRSQQANRENVQQGEQEV